MPGVVAVVNNLRIRQDIPIPMGVHTNHVSK